MNKSNFTFWPSIILLVVLFASTGAGAIATAQAAGTGALALSGTNGYVILGNAPALGLKTFTLEAWIKITGTGRTAFTGTGGVEAVPLITKGRGEDDGSNVDMNYFLGLRSTDNVLVADFEDIDNGQNHPLIGVTKLRKNTWYHVAASFDGRKWQLYLNGVLEAAVTVNHTPRYDSIQPAALGTALDSKAEAAGFFAGVLDEVRIWNYARPVLQLRDGMPLQITSEYGLVGRWSLNESSGNIVQDTAGNNINGNLLGTDWARSRGRDFSTNRAPAIPVLIAPIDSSQAKRTSATLNVTVADPDGDNLIVTYYGRMAGTKGPNFSIAVLPDTQYYSANLNGGSPEIFKTQTEWIVNQRAAGNIAYVAHLGDCVENGNDFASEWDNAEAALKLLENPLTTGLVEGIPYGLAVGNHDQSPDGDPDGDSTRLYNNYFGTARFYQRSYYGGRYGSQHDNHYQLFSASGLDFIVIYLEYDPAPDAAILSWADSLLKAYSTRRAIIVSHYLLELDASFSPQGQAVYEALKNNANLSLLLSGHVPGESHRQNSYNGQTVHTIMADYQNETSGGNGWLRLLEFAPATNELRVKTWSPLLNEYNSAASSQFTLSYKMPESGFKQLRINPNVAASAKYTWSGLQPNTEYEWYVTVSDGFTTVSSPVWKFKTNR